MKHLLLILTLALITPVAFGQSSDSTPARAADNSKSNSAPANSSVHSSTADGQSNSAADMKITQRIRKSVMADKHLSTYAHNVKIVTINGAVTLNGPVRSEREKSKVAMKAQAIAGSGNITNELTVTPMN